jgi:hypothetical protein
LFEAPPKRATALKIAKKPETIGPFYEPGAIVECPTCYPVFSPGCVQDIRLYKEPMECTLYAMEDSYILYKF